ncbi:homing endonuclease [Vibrio phage PVA8]|nr:homing endonuclease [Vibrio phage PC-Liy1]URQ03086.1 homing endonuclease [Vibrio phage PVA8]WBM58822.1 hypothetical protein vBValMPVA8_100 [Vibrio phage vB_ValM_PVA8]
MNYSKIYDDLMERARYRTIDGYSETHHIIPRCMNGDDSASNLVKLTAREHYIAHQLLAKIHPEHAGLVFAAIRMTMSPSGDRVNNRLYSWLREKNSEHSSERMREWYKNNEHPKGFNGKSHSSETKSLISKNTTNALREKIAVEVHMFDMNGKYIRTFDALTDAANFVGASNASNIKYTAEGKHQYAYGYRWSYDLDASFDDIKAPRGKNNGKMYITNGVDNKMITKDDVIPSGWRRGKTQKNKSDSSAMNQLATCPHCGKQTNKGNALRWHYDNCKEKHV